MQINQPKVQQSRLVLLEKGSELAGCCVPVPLLSQLGCMAPACSMNPLGLKPERFVVAVDQNEMMLGFGQLQPYGDPDRATFHELRTLIVDPAHR